VALNCTITKVNENTIAVRDIMPEAMEEKIAVAAETLSGDASPGKMRLSYLGNVSAAASATPAYNAGIPQALN
jgi:hypothetical protein